MEFEFYEIYVTVFVMKKKARKLLARDKNHTDTQPQIIDDTLSV